MDEHGRNGTQLQVAGVEIRAPLQDRFFLRMLPPQLVATNPLAMLRDAAYGFHYPDRAVAHRPVDLRCMPQLQLLWVDGSFVRQDPPCFRQQLRLVVLEQSQAAGDFTLSVLLETNPYRDGKSRADQCDHGNAVIVLNLFAQFSVHHMLALTLHAIFTGAHKGTADFYPVYGSDDPSPRPPGAEQAIAFALPGHGTAQS